MVEKNAGFTLIELVVVIAVITILAGILTPILGNLIDQARVSRATSEVKVLAEAIANLYKDTTYWPRANNPITTSAQWNAKQNGLFGDSITGLVDALNPTGTTGYPSRSWKGPYLPKPVENDPWTNSYRYQRTIIGGRTYSGVMSCGLNKSDDGALNNASLIQMRPPVNTDDIAYYLQ